MCWMAAVMGSASVGSTTVKSSPKSQKSRLVWLAEVTEEAHQLRVGDTGTGPEGKEL